MGIHRLQTLRSDKAHSSGRRNYRSASFPAWCRSIFGDAIYRIRARKASCSIGTDQSYPSRSERNLFWNWQLVCHTLSMREGELISLVGWSMKSYTILEYTQHNLVTRSVQNKSPKYANRCNMLLIWQWKAKLIHQNSLHIGYSSIAGGKGKEKTRRSPW